MSTAPTIIDAWMQHPTPRFMAQPWLDSLKRWTGNDFAGPWPLAATLASMDAGSVAVGLISAWVGPMGALVSNDEVAGWVAQAPGRLVGIGSVDISRPMEAVRELRRCVKQLGFRGVRVLPWLWEMPPTHPRFYPLFAECCELGVPFCTQVGHTGPLRSSETGRPIPYLDDVALDFPDLVIVAGHIGYPWTEEMVALTRKYPNVHVDTSAYTARRYPPELVRYLQRDGRKKVLFGTNWPMISPEKALEDLDDLELEPEACRRFLSENARAVFGV